MFDAKPQKEQLKDNSARRATAAAFFTLSQKSLKWTNWTLTGKEGFTNEYVGAFTPQYSSPP
jgi:hypothetical protein